MSTLGGAASSPTAAHDLASASVDPSSGVLHTRIAFALPTARGDIQPGLSLDYSSAGGYGVGGYGWDLNLPSIERHNPSGVPTFTNSDHFRWGGLNLVEVTTHAESTPQFVERNWREYRLEVEDGSLARFFCTPTTLQWVVTYGNGTREEYGSDHIGGAGSTDTDSTGRIYRWNLSARYDAHRVPNSNGLLGPMPANLIAYNWIQKGPESGTSRGYLSDIFDTPVVGIEAPTPAQFAHHVHLDYVGQWAAYPDGRPYYGAPSILQTQTWATKPNFLLSGVDITGMDYGAGGAGSLANPPVPPSAQRAQMRRYQLLYIPQVWGPPQVSEIDMQGSCSANNPTEDPATFLLPTDVAPCLAAPSQYFTYVQAGPPTSLYGQIVGMPDVEITNKTSLVGLRLLGTTFPTPTLYDINGDGLPDLITPGGDANANAARLSLSHTSGANVLTSVQPTAATVYDPPAVLQLPANDSSLSWDPNLFTSWSPNFSLGSFLLDGRLDVGWSPYYANNTSGTGPTVLATLSPQLTAGNWSMVWGAQSSFAFQAAFPWYEEPYAALDVDGDGITDLVSTLSINGNTNSTSCSLQDNGQPGCPAQLNLRLSSRDASGHQYTFAGGGDGNGNVCVGGLDPTEQVDASKHPTFADMNGDGLIDYVQLTATAGRDAPGLSWWPGHGDGIFGACPTGDLQCTCAQATEINAYFATAPASFDNASLHDIDGDGLPDLIVGTATGVDVYHSGETVSDLYGSPSHVVVGATLGWTGDSSSDTITFADMDGSGVDDIVIAHPIPVNGSENSPNVAHMAYVGGGVRPGLLRSIARGGTSGSFATTYTIIMYESLAQLGVDTANVAAEGAWSTSSPQSGHAVTSIFTTDATQDSFQTSYAYANPVYDPWDRTFVGFQRVKSTPLGPPTVSTETTFAYVTCGASPLSACAPGPDHFYHAYRGLPVLTEVFATEDAGGLTYLSTTHHSYTASVLATGIGSSVGQNVRRVWDAQTDTYVYDTGAFKGQTSSASIPDINVPSDNVLVNAGFVIRDTASHLQITTLLDAAGNVKEVDDHGVVGVDDTIATLTPMSIPAGVDPYNSWIWRPESVTVTDMGSSGPVGVPRTKSFTYNAVGDVTDVKGTLMGSGLTPLMRSNASGGGTAPGPQNASQDGSVYLEHLTYTSDGTGNVLFLERYPGTTSGNTIESRCTRYDFEQSFYQYQTAESEFAAGCNKGTVVYTQHAFDTIVERETLSTGSDLQTTIRGYDGLGRVTSLRRPNAVTPGVTDPVSTTITYADTSYGQLEVMTNQDVITQPPPPPYVVYRYLDAFGRPIVSVSTADTSAGDGGSWITSGFVLRDALGRITANFLPQFTSVAPGSSPPALVPSAPHVGQGYDEFGHVTESIAVDGSYASSTTYHGLTIVAYDAEQLGGSHRSAHTVITRDGHGRVTDRTDIGNSGQIVTHLGYLPTGEVTSVSRSGTDAGGAVSYARSATYDSLGRMLSNVEPNTAGSAGHGWRYAYNDLGDLVGTSDARGCGKNLAYDGFGRLVSEDFSPCTPAQQPYGAPPASDGTNTETFYVYETTTNGAVGTGRVSEIFDRASHVQVVYDARGRASIIQKQIAAPGSPSPSLTARYAPTWYQNAFAYDDRDRITTQATGATAPELLSFLDPLQGTSNVTASYSARGLLHSVNGSYGPLITSITSEADGRRDAIIYGDTAATTTSFLYNDPKQRLTEVTIARTAPFPGPQNGYTLPPTDTMEPSLQAVLLHDVVPPAIGYDGVGNPLEIDDQRDPNEWPPGAEPVLARQFGYDDAYRLTNETRTYAMGWTSFGAPGTDQWNPPVASSSPGTSPLPLSSAPAYRMTSQGFQYDGLGNSVSSSDDTPVFFDRSLGKVANGKSATAPGPNQLASATLSTTAGVSGNAAAAYDDAGNLIHLGVQRAAPCTGSGACSQVFAYDWDEVGRLAEARRYDLADGDLPSNYPSPAVPANAPAADAVYSYDASGQRVLRTDQAANASGAAIFNAEIFPSLRLNATTWVGGDYVSNAETEGVYLVLDGQMFGRVVNAPNSPALHIQGDATVPGTENQHVFLELGDELGSTAVVIDQETSELVERTTYTAYGSVESDYRPSRWNFREDYKFTGKEEDVEFGLMYFGARYYSPYLGRWMSPDPLTIHGGGADLNPYAYVAGRVTTAVDPLGLDPPGDTVYVRGPSPSSALVPDFGTWYPNPNHCDICLQVVNASSTSKLPAETVYVHGAPRVQAPTPPLPSTYTGPSFDAEPEHLVMMTGGVRIVYHGTPVYFPPPKSNIPRDKTGLIPKLGGILLPFLVPEARALEGIALRAGEAAAPGMRAHHILPQAEDLATEFEARGLNIEEFRVQVSQETHADLHTRSAARTGIRGLGPGGVWNTSWRTFFATNPNATASEILEYATDLLVGNNVPYYTPLY